MRTIKLSIIGVLLVTAAWSAPIACSRFRASGQNSALTRAQRGFGLGQFLRNQSGN
jgi:hypothetical protein